LRPFVEKVISIGKIDSLHNRRQVRKILYLPGATKKVFEVLGPRFKEVNGGYTRIVKLEPRFGDNAEMAILELAGGDESAKLEHKEKPAKEAVSSKKSDKPVAKNVKSEETKEEKPQK